MPLEISIEERRAAASLLARLATRDRRLAEHALACGALAATLARMLDLPEAGIARASILGTLHEVGMLAELERPPAHVTSTPLEHQRGLRSATLVFLRAEPALARFADDAGTLFDDVVPAIEARIVVVADIYDALTRHLPGVAGLTKRGAVDVLKSLAGPRVDPDVVHALIFSQRRGQRQSDVSA
jgi:HD-GYP domain-containing protein (c-di-GMP phosphodiesterase class II)